MSNQLMVDRFRRWFEQECDAMVRTMASLESVPENSRDAPEFRKAMNIVAHMVVARSIWLKRFDGSMPASPMLFPPDRQLTEIASDWEGTRQAWERFLTALTDEQLGEEFPYRSSDGATFRNTYEEVLVQLFSHSAYHRGQIAMLVRAAGGEPAITDYIYWCRRPAN